MKFYDDRPVLHMLAGPVCSGKSTWVSKNNEALQPYHYVSTDEYIELEARKLGKNYNDVYRLFIDDANDFMYRMIEADTSSANSYNIVWDQTNLTPKVRQSKLRRIPRRYFKIGVFFVNATKELIAERNIRPGKIIPAHVVDGMLSSYVIPKSIKDEPWFDEISFVDAATGDEIPQIAPDEVVFDENSHMEIVE